MYISYTSRNIILFLKYFFNFFFFWERKRICMHGHRQRRGREWKRQRERERERENPKQTYAVSTEPNSSLLPMNREIMTWAETKSQTLNPPSHQAPQEILFSKNAQESEVYIRSRQSSYNKTFLKPQGRHEGLTTPIHLQVLFLCLKFKKVNSLCGRSTAGLTEFPPDRNWKETWPESKSILCNQSRKHPHKDVCMLVCVCVQMHLHARDG